MKCVFVIFLALLPAAGVLAASPLPSPSAAVSGSPLPAPSPLPALPAKVTPAEGKSLLREFQKAQKSELQALEFRQKFELKELKASQAARRKEWEAKESAALKDFLKQQKKGPEIRNYTADRKARHAAFLQLLTEELSQRVQNQQVRLNSVKSEQASRLKDFQASIGRGERPSAQLWPQPGI